MRPVYSFFVIVALVPALARAAPPDPAGVVKNVAGKVTIIREGQTVEAAPNTLLFAGDVVVTGSNGRAGLILEDDTILSIGRRSNVVLARYAYQPEEGTLALFLRLLRGTLLYISGKIEKAAPDAVRIETPDAVIGVRGSEVMIEVD